MAAAGSSESNDWMFDVSALMVLVSESEELKYRLSGRDLVQALCATPVSGIQTYLKSYDILLEPTSYTYFSPYGCKSAPLRNTALDNAIKRCGLLEDGKCTYFRVHPAQRSAKIDHLKLIWAAFTWVCMGGLLLACRMAPKTTWIGLTNCVAFTGWSIILRVIEYVMVKPAIESESTVTRSDSPDAVFILGRNNSALILSGSRRDIKAWTSRGLTYNQNSSSRRATSFWQAFTYCGTLLVILLSFSTIPNGSTSDQVIFVVLNVLGQANTLMGLWLSGSSYLKALEKLPQSEENLTSRTHLYASLIRYFKDIEDQTWIEKAGLLPQTDLWSEWKDRIINEPDADPKVLYNMIDNVCKTGHKRHETLDSAKTIVVSKSKQVDEEEPSTLEAQQIGKIV
ncbi:hypothetical protein E8E14_000113 [Neopestalotiopsis sp. 37M]|nr:hypothetical protein E8E14_000113 [Neopestalotiopsis sp. 37M]